MLATETIQAPAAQTFQDIAINSSMDGDVSHVFSASALCGPFQPRRCFMARTSPAIMSLRSWRGPKALHADLGSSASDRWICLFRSYPGPRCRPDLAYTTTSEAIT